jgi:hypothetical protein
MASATVHLMVGRETERLARLAVARFGDRRKRAYGFGLLAWIVGRAMVPPGNEGLLPNQRREVECRVRAALANADATARAARRRSPR